jgi:hypothetical protein
LGTGCVYYRLTQEEASPQRSLREGILQKSGNNAWASIQIWVTISVHLHFLANFGNAEEMAMAPIHSGIKRKN